MQQDHPDVIHSWICSFSMKHCVKDYLNALETTEKISNCYKINTTE